MKTLMAGGVLLLLSAVASPVGAQLVRYWGPPAHYYGYGGGYGPQCCGGYPPVVYPGCGYYPYGYAYGSSYRFGRGGYSYGPTFGGRGESITGFTLPGRNSVR